MVKCSTCGFAAKRTRVLSFPNPNPVYYEIPVGERQKDGLPVLHFATGGSAHEHLDIACFRGNADLLGEVKRRQQDDPPTTTDNRLLPGLRELTSNFVLDEDRVCDGWYQYVVGRTPQEHLADFMWEQLEKQHRELENSLAARAESVQLQLAERDEQMQAQRDREQGRNTKLITRITIVGVLIAFAQVLTLTKDSVLWKVIAAIYHWLIGQ